MSMLQAAGQAVTQAVSDIGTGVADSAKSAISDTAKQIAKTPLDILEELLGSSGAGGGDADSGTAEKGNDAVSQAQIAQKMKQDESFKVEQHQALHDKIQQQSQVYFEQKKQEDAQKRAAADQQKEQERFEIKQLEKSKAQNLQVQMAQDAANAEKRVGAG